jgi:hypothetical protein
MCLFLLVVLGFEYRASPLLGSVYHVSYSFSLFLCVCWVFSRQGSWTICLGWLQTVILLISSSWIARISGMSHWIPAYACFWWTYLMVFLMGGNARINETLVWSSILQFFFVDRLCKIILKELYSCQLTAQF